MKLTLINRLSKDEFAAIVANAFCIKDVVRALGYGTVNGANSATVKNRINEEQLDTSHFKAKAAKSYTDTEIFCANTEASQSALRRRFKIRAFVPYICAVCGQLPVWQNKPLTLILDHIDGDNRNGDLANLRWVCPNCNQQLPTTGFHGIKYRDPNNKVKLPSTSDNRSYTKHIKAHCPPRPTIRPERDKLITELFNSSLTEVGKSYGVSPNAVQKWLKYYKVPHTKEAFNSWYYINILNEQPPVKEVKIKLKLEPKAVLQYNKTGEFVCKHSSCTAASKTVFGDTVHINHISATCNGRRKSAYGYIWKFAD